MFRFSEQKERKKERKQKGRTLSDTMYKVAFLRLLFLNNSKRHSFAHRQGLQLLIERVSSLETTRKGVTDSRGLWIVGRGLPGWYLILMIGDIWCHRGYLWLDTHPSTDPAHRVNLGYIKTMVTSRPWFNFHTRARLSLKRRINRGSENRLLLDKP